MNLNEKEQKVRDAMIKVAQALVELSDGKEAVFTKADSEVKIPDKQKKLVMHFEFDIVDISENQTDEQK